MAKTEHYSPLPITDYFVETRGKCSIEAVADLEESVAVWNLFWLSLPELDSIPGSGKGWYKGYTTNGTLQEALVTDVYEDSVLRCKLKMAPADFLSWWKREDHTIYDSYLIGGKDWVETVTARAAEAAERLSLIEYKQDNVIKVKFGKAA